MQQRDYLLRMIEQIGRVLTVLRNRILRREDDLGTRRDQLAAAARQGNVDLELARDFTPETLVLMVSMGGEVEPGRAWLLAELLYLDGLDAHLAGDAERAEASLTRALVLYRLIGPDMLRIVELPEMSGRVDEIERLLDGPPPPAS